MKKILKFFVVIALLAHDYSAWARPVACMPQNAVTAASLGELPDQVVDFLKEQSPRGTLLLATDLPFENASQGEISEVQHRLTGALVGRDCILVSIEDSTPQHGIQTFTFSKDGNDWTMVARGSSSIEKMLSK